MKQICFFVIICLFCAQLFSCGQRSLSSKEYLEWVENEKNGLLQKNIVNGFQFYLQYEPLEYIVVKESQKNEISKEYLEKRKKELEGYTYFTLTILNNNNQSPFKTDSADIAGYHEMSMQQDFSFVCSSMDTLPCTFYLFENHGGISPDKILLGFENNSNLITNGFTLIYNAKILKLGSIRFSYSKEDLQQIPELNIK